MASTSDALWNSFMLGDEAQALAEKGAIGESLRVAESCGDVRMTMLAHTRVAAMMFERKQTNAGSLKSLLKTAAKIKESDPRDFALRVAAGRLGSK